MKALLAVADGHARRLLAETLSDRGHEVTVGADPAAAEELLERGTGELVIVGGPDPATLCRRLRALPDGEDRYLLLLPDAPGRAGVEAGLAAGADDFLTLPLTRRSAELRLMIGERLAAERRRRRLVKDDLRRERAYFQQLFRNSPAGIVILDGNDCVVDANRAFVRLFQYEPAEMRGRPLGDFIVPEALRQEATELSQTVFRKQSVERETVRRRKDGSEVEVAIVGYPVELADRRTGAFGIYNDITARKRAERKLFHDAFHDALTGLPNRALLIERLTQALKRGGRSQALLALLFLDLDRFKAINDGLGHAAGDGILVETARRLERSVRPGDTTARLAGDEFTVILDDLRQPSDATRVAERILAALEEPFEVAGQPVVCTGSIGIAFSAAGSESAEQLLRDADLAMYRAKARGKARYEIFDPEMHESAVARLRLEGDLRAAIDRQELTLHYQPIVALSSGRVVGVEALLRWRHPQRGLLGPEEILPVSEETGLIVPLGRWVLAESCRRLAGWRRCPGAEALTVAINVSAQELTHPGFLAELERTAAANGVDPAAVGFEITESLLTEAADALAAVLHQLQAAGFRVAIDDFGTGGSALAALEHLPIDSLKIDPSLVRALTPGQGAKLIRAITALGRGLGLTVLAEGVETEGQRSLLQGLGVERAQGYLFAAALPPDEVEALLTAGRA